MQNLKVNFTRTLGVMKPMHGVVNGPTRQTEPAGLCFDVTARYQEAGVPFIRFHDSSCPNAEEVDIHAVFPDLSKDPADPASYDFRKTDLYLESAAATGAELRYRLGETIEDHKIKVYTYPPADMEKWAQVCVGILKHYNEGWANGFHYNIRYWEIWEEPDNIGPLWNGTPEEFYRLYTLAAKALKAHAPDIKVGGYAASNVYLPFFDGFLAYVQKENAPLDFFSLDWYSDDPESYPESANYARQKLDSFGFRDTELVLAEWNNCGFAPDEPFWTSDPDKGAERAQRRVSQQGAAFTASSLIRMQNSVLDAAAFYVFNTHNVFWSAFDCFGRPYKVFYPFVAFNVLYRLGTQAAVEGETDCLAARNEQGDGAILLSNFCEEEQTYALDVTLPAQGQYRLERYLLDEANNLTLTGATVLTGDFRDEIICPKYAVVLLRLQRI